MLWTHSKRCKLYIHGNKFKKGFFQKLLEFIEWPLCAHVQFAIFMNKEYSISLIECVYIYIFLSQNSRDNGNVSFLTMRWSEQVWWMHRWEIDNYEVPMTIYAIFYIYIYIYIYIYFFSSYNVWKHMRYSVLISRQPGW